MTAMQEVPTETEPRCTECRRAKPIEEFFSSTLRRNVTSCAPCRASHRARNDRDAVRLGPEGIRDKNLRAKYGIGAAEYDALREGQGYRCAICGDHEDDIPVIKTGRPRKDGQPPAASFRLVVDHCHNSSRVRGLLCARCNAAIGLLRESPGIIQNAAAYVTGTRIAGLPMSTIRQFGP